MPALYLFNRRTLLAGDDLQLPSLAWGCLSAVQLFLLLPYLLYFTIELLLLRGSLSDPENNYLTWEQQRFADLSGFHDVSVDKRYHERNVLDVDDYITSMEQRFPNMHSAECAQATAGFSDMTYPFLILLYFFGMSGFCAVSLWYEQKIFQLSSLGTPTLNIDLRAPLRKFIESKMTLLAGVNLFLLVYASACTIRFIADFVRCFSTMWWITWFVLLGTQGLQCLFAFTTLISILRVKPSASRVEGSSTDFPSAVEPDFYHQHTDHLHTHNNAEIAEEIWRGRCEGCCRVLAVSTCFLFGGQSIVSQASEGSGEKFYGDISRALADYFAGFGDMPTGEPGLDVVPSDVALGFVVLRHIQAQRKLLARRDALQQMGYGSQRGSSIDLTEPNNATTQVMNRRTLLFRWRNKSSSTQSIADVEAEGSSIRNETNSISVTDHPIISRTDEEYQSFSRVVLSPLNSEDVAAIDEGAHFARHQLAIYTWMLYFYMFPVTGTLRLIGRVLREKMQCGNSTIEGSGRNYGRCSLDIDGENAPTNETIVGDNFLHTHEATMLAHARLDKSDIAYASFEAGFYETPYFIVVDREWKSVVLSIRGSLTLEDCVVDVLLDPSPLDNLGEQYGFSGNGQYCHGGVLECTQWLYADLTRHKILDKLLLGENSEYSDYTLRIVGHSLGAGIGVILSLMLRNTFPNLRCICYSPPGGLLTWELATSCSDFVNSFVLDSDIVPRLSLNNMESLRDEVLNLIARVKLSKYDIAKSIFWHGLCGEVELGDLDFLIQQNDDMLYPSDNVPDSAFLRQLRRFESMQQNRRSTRGVAREIKLYPPGKIVHLVKTGQNKHCVHSLTACLTCGASNAGSEYTPIRKENDDFNEVEISPTLWTDHFPNRVCIEIERVAARFGINATRVTS
ncbi:hypothetical protein HJC23_011458 [Cyclotella cryptica]|uniref:sn-1-specific diacylglycerol lipase n=1 Tax=Cyclotella cryptica TaxID=29204 RepID=A0ABD3NST6_9STRA|eukprot:CCRYP_019875-RA/>CCRYP_019875-RA protein AED:0.42 eAED:0.42 QI:229/0.5/0.33/1/1/1/3/0/904